MVRYVWIGTMLAILCIVLYIPSASPPERFTEVLRAEHDITRDIWGPVVADRILSDTAVVKTGKPLQPFRVVLASNAPQGRTVSRVVTCNDDEP